MKKERKSAAELSANRTINRLTTASLLDLDVVDYCRLYELADVFHQRRLVYLFKLAELEGTIRRVIREEAAKAAKSSRINPPTRAKGNAAQSAA